MKRNATIALILWLWGYGSGMAGEEKLRYRLIGEGGLSHTRFSHTAGQLHGISRLESRATLSHDAPPAFWQLQLRFRPELYSTTPASHLIHLQLRGDYARQWKRFQGNLSLTGQQQRLRTVPLRLTHSLLLISLNTAWHYRAGRTFIIRGSYSHRRLEGHGDTRLTSFHGFLRWRRIFSPFRRLELGIFAERFYIQARYSTPGNPGPARNRGWRIGPEISARSARKLLISATYRLAFHRSRRVGKMAYHHQLRLLLGKTLASGWSLFGLVDLFLRSSGTPRGILILLLYTSLDTENRVYLKLEKQVNRTSEIFLRVGYLSENFLADTPALSGWQFTAGLDWQP